MPETPDLDRSEENKQSDDAYLTQQQQSLFKQHHLQDYQNLTQIRPELPSMIDINEAQNRPERIKEVSARMTNILPPIAAPQETVSMEQSVTFNQMVPQANKSSHMRDQTEEMFTSSIKVSQNKGDIQEASSHVKDHLQGDQQSEAQNIPQVSTVVSARITNIQHQNHPPPNSTQERVSMEQPVTFNQMVPQTNRQSHMRDQTEEMFTSSIKVSQKDCKEANHHDDSIHVELQEQFVIIDSQKVSPIKEQLQTHQSSQEEFKDIAVEIVQVEPIKDTKKSTSKQDQSIELEIADPVQKKEADMNLTSQAAPIFGSRASSIHPIPEHNHHSSLELAVPEEAVQDSSLPKIQVNFQESQQELDSEAINTSLSLKDLSLKAPKHQNTLDHEATQSQDNNTIPDEVVVSDDIKPQEIIASEVVTDETEPKEIEKFVSEGTKYIKGVESEILKELGAESDKVKELFDKIIVNRKQPQNVGRPIVIKRQSSIGYSESGNLLGVKADKVEAQKESIAIDAQASVAQAVKNFKQSRITYQQKNGTYRIKPKRPKIKIEASALQQRSNTETFQPDSFNEDLTSLTLSRIDSVNESKLTSRISSTITLDAAKLPHPIIAELSEEQPPESKSRRNTFQTKKTKIGSGVVAQGTSGTSFMGNQGSTYSKNSTTSRKSAFQSKSAATLETVIAKTTLGGVSVNEIVPPNSSNTKSRKVAFQKNISTTLGALSSKTLSGGTLIIGQIDEEGPIQEENHIRGAGSKSRRSAFQVKNSTKSDAGTKTASKLMIGRIEEETQEDFLQQSGTAEAAVAAPHQQVNNEVIDEHSFETEETQ